MVSYIKRLNATEHAIQDLDRRRKPRLNPGDDSTILADSPINRAVQRNSVRKYGALRMPQTVYIVTSAVTFMVTGVTVTNEAFQAPNSSTRNEC